VGQCLRDSIDVAVFNPAVAEELAARAPSLNGSGLCVCTAQIFDERTVHRKNHQMLPLFDWDSPCT
jgi:hypothetical protein